MDYLPLPIINHSYPWGSNDCHKCPGRICYGHFLTPEAAEQSNETPMRKPPSQILKEAFRNLKGREPSDTETQELSRATLLPPGEVEVWLTHLQSIQLNRKRGAEKAAATRRWRAVSEAPRYICLCGEEYLDCTDDVQHWIGCDKCSSWYHCQCVGVDHVT